MTEKAKRTLTDGSGQTRPVAADSALIAKRGSGNERTP